MINLRFLEFYFLSRNYFPQNKRSEYIEKTQVLYNLRAKIANSL